MKSIYWFLIAGVLLIAAVVFFQITRGNKAIEVYTEKAVRRNIIETVSATGKIQPETEVKISSDVSGEITELHAREGQKVKKGDLLCRIRPDVYLSAFERVNASVNTTRANLKTAQAQLEQAKANLINNESLYNRNKQLFEQQAISQQEFETIKAQYESARANVRALEETVKAGEYSIAGSVASLKEAQNNLDRTYIYSPVDATVSRLSVEKGERVVGVTGMAGTEIMRLANMNEMEVNVEVNENDIIKVHRNDTAIIEVDAYMGKKFRGVVTEIANSSNATGISLDQVTNFTVKVRMLRESYSNLITAENPIPFRPGMSASVDIQTRRAASVISVPIQAVTVRSKDSLNLKRDESDGRNVVIRNQNEERSIQKEEKLREIVFLHAGGEAKRREVITGIQDSDHIEIIEGLSEDEEVICGPYSAVSRSLKENSKVKVVKKEDIYRTGKP